MRPFEALLIAATASAILRGTAFAGTGWPSWSPAMPIAIAALLALHLALEGWRGQMLPAYAVAAAWLALQALHVALPGAVAPRASIGWIAAGGAGCLALLAALGLAAARPIVQAPAPSGPLPIGTALVPLEAGRDAPVFQVWYPALPGSLARPAPLTLEARAANRRGTLSRSAALLDAQIAPASPGGPARLPLLLFFPGWGGIPSQNTVLIQDLASHGYVVAAVDAWSPAFYPGDAGAMGDLATPLVSDSDEAAAAGLAAGARNAPRQAALARRLLDRLTALDTHDPAGRLTGRLALDRVGMLGFSFGGSVSVETATGDPRIAAVANLDGGVFTDAYRRGFRAPYLLLSEPPMTEADLHSPDPAVRRDAVPTLQDEANLAGFMRLHGGIRAIIDGAAHSNFTDAPLLTPWRRLGGRIDPVRARAIVDALLLAFFDHHLRGAPGPVPDRLAGYPDVTIVRWPTPPEAGAPHAVQNPAPTHPAPPPDRRDPSHARLDQRSLPPAGGAVPAGAAAFAATADLRRPGGFPP